MNAQNRGNEEKSKDEDEDEDEDEDDILSPTMIAIVSRQFSKEIFV